MGMNILRLIMKEKATDVGKDDNAYSKPSDEEWKTFLYDHEYYNCVYQSFIAR